MEQGIDRALPQEKTVVLREHSESDSVRRYEAKVAKRQPTRDEVKAQLDSKSAEITARLESIQSDVFGSGQKVKELLSESPLLPIAGAIVGGLTVGLIFGGSKKRQSRKGPVSSEMSEILVQQVQAATATGDDPVEAVSRSINRLMQSESVPKRQSMGLMSALGGLLVNFAVRQAITYVEGRTTGGSASSSSAPND